MAKGEIYKFDTKNSTDTTKTTSNIENYQFTSEVREELKQNIDQYRAAVLTDMNTEDSDLRKVMNANGVYRPEDMKFNTSFYRFPRADPFNYVDGAREYLFFTKPDLPLVNQAESSGVKTFLTGPAQDIPYFTDLAESAGYRESIFKNLSYSAAKKVDGCPFIRILSNRKTSNMDVPDIEVEELETAINQFGTKILYPTSSQGNDEDMDFTIEFEDTRFLEIFHLFKVWDYYRILKWYGVLTPGSFIDKHEDAGVGTTFLESIGIPPDQDPSENDYSRYVFYKVLNDHIRVFKFLVDNDGETILYAASAIGCYPKTIQRSAFSEIAERGPLKVSIGFKISGWFEDNLTSTVNDFNVIVNGWVPQANWRDSESSIYDYDLDVISQDLVDVPWISREPAVPIGTPGAGRMTDFYTYKLKWSKFNK